MTTFERDYLVQDGKTVKWGGGKSKVRTAWVKHRGRNWVDIRMLRRSDEGYTHTREGVRITPDQLRELMPVLAEMLDHIDNSVEQEERRKEVVEHESVSPKVATEE